MPQDGKPDIKQPVEAELSYIRQQAKHLFSAGKFTEAVELYSILANLAPNDHTVFSNRAAALTKLGQPDEAFQDAQVATKLAPGWAKGWYRQGVALSMLERHSQAAAAFSTALSLEPGNKELHHSLQLAAQKAHAQQHACSVQRQLQALHVSWALTTARQTKERGDMVRQLEQGMVGYCWEPQDWEWRPTWPPAATARPPKLLTAEEPPANGTHAAPQEQPQAPGRQQEQAQPRASGQQHLRSFLASYTHALADLEAPRVAALGIARDADLLDFYASALEHALGGRPGAHVLVTGRSGGVLALLAAAAGAGSVTDVAQSPLLHRMAHVLLQGNREAVPGLCELVQLAPCALEDCWLAGAGPKIKGSGSAAGVTRAAGEAGTASAADNMQGGVWEMAEPAHVLVTDLFGYSDIGPAILTAIEAVVKHGLVAPDALIVPAGISVHAALVEARTTAAAGFDLSPLNQYRWHPTAAAVNLAKDKGVQLLSASQPVATVDLQGHLHTLFTGRCGQAGHIQLASNLPEMVQCDAAREGVVTGVASWLQLHSPSSSISTFADEGANTSGARLAGMPAAQSSKQGLQYLDKFVDVAAGQQVSLGVQHQQGSFTFWAPSRLDSYGEDSSGPPARRLRHASLPSWHFDMVADVQRNTAYDAAIRQAIVTRRAVLPQGTPLRVLDIGAGTGLLSLMAARAGADEVTAVECVGHLAEVAEHIIALNGGSSAITVLHKDGRYLTTGTQPDGRPGDLAAPADLLVFEVFDSGLIGEGALHIIAAARSKVLVPNATLVPSAAKVFCQPIQYKRLGQLRTVPHGKEAPKSAYYSSIDTAHLNQFAWRPGYFGADLSGSSSAEWRALGPPKEVLVFDFATIDPHAAFQPLSTEVCFDVSSNGRANAVAFWFELQLGEGICLNTGPYAGAGATWQQAVQYVQERPVTAGDTMRMVASHDTYSIMFRWADDHTTAPVGAAAVVVAHMPQPLLGDVVPASNSNQGEVLLRAAANSGASVAATDAQEQTMAAAPAPVVDPVWYARHQQLEALGQGLAASTARDPLEYRKLACAALELAARPQELGADAAQAAALCTRMMM